MDGIIAPRGLPCCSRLLETVPARDRDRTSRDDFVSAAPASPDCALTLSYWSYTHTMAAVSASTAAMMLVATAKRTVAPRAVMPGARVPADKCRVAAPSRRLRPRASHVSRAGNKTSDPVTEVANMDSLIDLLVDADEEQLLKLVAENVLSFDQKMWIRIASRSDAAESQEEKDKIMMLASKCMKIIETMVESTEDTIKQSSKLLQDIVAAAANPDTGEFDVPLKADALARMSKKMEGAEVDERMLNTVYAWIRKSDEDKLDGMVHILQHLLQCYAARELDAGKTPLDSVIAAPAAEWPEKFEEIMPEVLARRLSTRTFSSGWRRWYSTCQTVLTPSVFRRSTSRRSRTAVRTSTRPRRRPLE